MPVYILQGPPGLCHHDYIGNFHKVLDLKDRILYNTLHWPLSPNVLLSYNLFPCLHHSSCHMIWTIQQRWPGYRSSSSPQINCGCLLKSQRSVVYSLRVLWVAINRFRMFTTYGLLKSTHSFSLSDTWFTLRYYVLIKAILSLRFKMSDRCPFEIIRNKFW